MAVLVPIKEGNSIVNGKESAMSADFPDWAYKAFSGNAKLIPVKTFYNQEVGEPDVARHVRCLIAPDAI